MNSISKLRVLAGAVLVTAALWATPPTAAAATISVVGNTNGSLATATATTSFDALSNTLTFTLLNTSPFDARITGVGFDLIAGDYSGNGSSGLDGFSGNDVGNFVFTDGALGNVPQISWVVLDYGWLTGSGFSGGSPTLGIAPGASQTFSVTGNSLASFTDATIASGIFVRFQQVGENGNLSDVGIPARITFQTEVSPSAVPEPASLTLLGSGLVGAARAVRRRRKK